MLNIFFHVLILYLDFLLGRGLLKSFAYFWGADMILFFVFLPHYNVSPMTRTLSFITTEQYLIQWSSINICWVNEWVILSKIHIFQIRKCIQTFIIFAQQHTAVKELGLILNSNTFTFLEESFKKLIIFATPA